MVRQLAIALFLITSLSGEVVVSMLCNDHTSLSIVDSNLESESEKENKEAEENSKKESKFNSTCSELSYRFLESKIQSSFYFLMKLSLPPLDVNTPPPEFS